MGCAFATVRAESTKTKPRESFDGRGCLAETESAESVASTSTCAVRTTIDATEVPALGGVAGSRITVNNHSMPDIELFRWYVPHDFGPKKGKLHLTSWHMTAEYARATYGPDVQPDPLSREVRSGQSTLAPSPGGERSSDVSLRLLSEGKAKE